MPQHTHSTQGLEQAPVIAQSVVHALDQALQALLVGIRGVWLFVASYLMTWTLKAWFHRKIGGVTGDPSIGGCPEGSADFSLPAGSAGVLMPGTGG